MVSRGSVYRTRLRGRPPRGLLPCGTHAAHVRHLARGEDTCDACKEAERLRSQARRDAARPNRNTADM